MNRSRVGGPLRRLHFRAGGLIFVALLVVAGCSESSDGRAADIPLDPELVAADEERARAAVLRIEDLPAGWESESESSDDEADDDEPVLPECEALDEADQRGRTAEAASESFVRENTLLSNSVSFFADDPLAEDAFGARFTSEVQRCLEEAMTQGIEEGIAGNPEVPAGAAQVEVEIGDLSVDPVGDARGGWSAVVDARVGARSVSMFADVVVVRVGRVVIDVMSLSVIVPPQEPYGPVLGAAVDRVAAALAT